MGINALVADGDAESFGDTSQTVQDRERKTDSSSQIVTNPPNEQHSHLYTCFYERSAKPCHPLAS